MKRRVAIAAITCAVAAGGAAAVELRGGDAAPVDDVPTFVVARVPFERRISADGTLRAVEATPVTAPQTSEDGGALKITWIATDGTAVKKGDVVVRFDPSVRENALRDGRADLDSATSKLREENVKSAALVGGRDDDSTLAAAELEQQQHFQPRDPTLYARKDIIESQVDGELAAAKQQHAAQAKTIERRLSQAKAGVISVDEAKAKLAIDHAVKDLDGMVVRAPHDGIIVLERMRGETAKIGDQLWPGQRFAEVPLLDKMEAELFVLEVDASGLAVGQPASVAIEAHPDTVYPGKLRIVDKLAKERIAGVPVRYFTTVVALDRSEPVMKPGQRVHGELVLDREDALVVPREAVVEASGKQYVFRRGAGGGVLGFERVAVELGAASAGRIVVKTGLAAGDVVALRDPTRSRDDATGGSNGSNARPAKP
jgi:HlyD family secretion protein